MAMQFWEAQRKNRFRTALFIAVFLCLAIAVSFLFELFLRTYFEGSYIPQRPYYGAFLLGFIVLVALFYYISFASFGGSVAPESMGGWRAGEGFHPREEQLINIVHEMGIASRLPTPQIYVIKAREINAFAAGLKPEKSVIAVTTGALDQLTRDELQGVVAHEYGHIASGDMKIGLRLSALLMGFFLVFYVGIRLLEGSMWMGRGERRGGALPLIALALLFAGAFLWFAGAVLRACVNREREYLADASGVQFTRNPEGLISALRKIKTLNHNVNDMPKSGLGFAHLYLDSRSFWCRLFATHPPLEKRIKRLQGVE